jgi:hypothetical protein
MVNSYTQVKGTFWEHHYFFAHIDRENKKIPQQRGGATLRDFFI